MNESIETIPLSKIEGRESRPVAYGEHNVTGHQYALIDGKWVNVDDEFVEPNHRLIEVKKILVNGWKTIVNTCSYAVEVEFGGGTLFFPEEHPYYWTWANPCHIGNGVIVYESPQNLPQQAKNVVYIVNDDVFNHPTVAHRNDFMCVMPIK